MGLSSSMAYCFAIANLSRSLSLALVLQVMGTEELAIVRRTMAMTFDRLKIGFTTSICAAPVHQLFQPVFKLVGTEKVDGKTIKSYDTPVTPYRRVLASDMVPLENKVRLTNLFVSLNPVSLRNSIDNKVAALWKITR